MGVRGTADGVIITIHVRPSARRDTLDTKNGIEIHTKEPPEGNRANAAVVKILRRALRVERNRISIIRGATGRTKQVFIAGMTVEELERSLQNGNLL